jgi:hypothetical protein
MGDAPLVPVPHHFVQRTGPFPEFSEIATVTHCGGFSLPSWPPPWLVFPAAGVLLWLAPELAPGLALAHPLKPSTAAAPPPPTIIPAATAAMRLLFTRSSFPCRTTVDTGPINIIAPIKDQT